MNRKSSRETLCYHGTDVDIRLGDTVVVKRLFRRPTRGIVTYVPGQSPRHAELESNGEKYWAVELEDGTLMSWLYLPGELNASKAVTFSARGDPGYAGLQPADDLGE